MIRCFRIGDIEETPKWLQFFGYKPLRRKEAEYDVSNNFGAKFWDNPIEDLDYFYVYLDKKS